jgi:hypothetical protein
MFNNRISKFVNRPETITMFWPCRKNDRTRAPRKAFELTFKGWGWNRGTLRKAA